MLIDTNTQTYIDAFSYDVKCSRNRQKVILLLDMNRKTPTDLVDEIMQEFQELSFESVRVDVNVVNNRCLKISQQYK